MLVCMDVVEETVHQHVPGEIGVLLMISANV